MTEEEAIEFALTMEKPAPAQPPAPLTRHEEEVAKLVARGFTNRRIASELFLSERTVHRHVSNVLKKLGVTSREQIGAKMAERQPLGTD